MSDKEDLPQASPRKEVEREPVVSEEIAEQLLARAEAAGVDILGPESCWAT